MALVLLLVVSIGGNDREIRGNKRERERRMPHVLLATPLLLLSSELESRSLGCSPIGPAQRGPAMMMIEEEKK